MEHLRVGVEQNMLNFESLYGCFQQQGIKVVKLGPLQM